MTLQPHIIALNALKLHCSVDTSAPTIAFKSSTVLCCSFSGGTLVNAAFTVSLFGCNLSGLLCCLLKVSKMREKHEKARKSVTADAHMHFCCGNTCAVLCVNSRVTLRGCSGVPEPNPDASPLMDACSCSLFETCCLPSKIFIHFFPPIFSPSCSSQLFWLCDCRTNVSLLGWSGAWEQWKPSGTEDWTLPWPAPRLRPTDCCFVHWGPLKLLRPPL